MKRFAYYAITLLLIAFSITTIAWYFDLLTPPKGISSKPPEKYASSPIHLIDSTAYLQNDPDWKYEPLGQTNETIGQVGCTLSSVAMALNNMGYKFTPETLNTSITRVNGYTQRGWLKWISISQVTNDMAKVDYYTEPSHEIINQCLRRGEYPIVKFMIKKVIPHWVIVTGRSGRDYFVRDPLVTSKNVIPLSSRSRRILAVRCVGDKHLHMP